MIPVTSYVVGFLIYVLFSVITYEAYSRREYPPLGIMLGGFYVYYTFLAGYTIWIMSEMWFNAIIQVVIYAIPAAFVCYFYYLLRIKPKFDEKNNSIYFT